MINRIFRAPELKTPSAELIKIRNLFETYPDISQLFLQNDTGALIFMLDRDVIIHGNIEIGEIKKFLSFLGAKSVFSGSDNMKLLFDGFNEANVLINERPGKHIGNNIFNDELSSREIYEILSTDKFVLPPYEHFATDYCRRLNHGKIKVFAKKDTAAAITLETENYRLLAGISSKKKGYGGALLQTAVSGTKPVLCVAEDPLVPFYTKFGFKPLYKAGHWRK